MLKLNHIRKSYDGVPVLQDIDLEIDTGEIVSILGSSGSGKTTLLNVILGITGCDGGRILFDGRDITRMPMEERGFNIVFQDYALFPNLNARQNITYGLRNRPDVSTPEEVEELIDLLGLREHLDKRIEQLSGGQKQRVALARTLVMKPRILLLDEPLSNLDARLRLEMREEIRRIQIETGVTTVFVTHDQEEAMSITDEIVLMKKGIVQQQCAPQEMYLNPGNQFVASFLGNPPISYFRFPVQDGCLQISDSCRLPLSLRHEGAVVTGIRPEAWRKGDGLAVQVQAVEQHGKDNQITFQLAGTKARALLDVTEPVRVGDTVSLTLDPRFVYFFDEATGTRLYGEAGQWAAGIVSGWRIRWETPVSVRKPIFICCRRLPFWACLCSIPSSRR